MSPGDNDSRGDLEQRALLGLVAADLMHDLRGSLAVVQLSLQVAESHLQSQALKGSALEETRACVDDALNAVAHLERLSTSVHLLGRTPPSAVLVSVDDEVTLACRLARYRFGPGADLLHQPSPDDTTVVGFAGELCQLTMNLVVNATDSSARIVEVSTRADGDAVLITVRDDGAGIASEELPHIFERAFTTKPRRGSGIGLAHAAAVAARHGGTVRVDSTPGAGSLFEVRVPRAHLSEGDAWQP